MLALFAGIGLPPSLTASPIPQDPPAGEQPAAAPATAEASASGRWFRGMLRSRYVGRWTSDDSDDDLLGILSLDVGDAAKDPLTAHVFGRVTYDLDGRDATFASINDSYGSRLDGLLYDAYVDVHSIDALPLVRLGRQSVDETPLPVWFDGAHVACGEIGEIGLQAGGYLGASTHFYESSPSGDLVAGAYAQAKPWHGGKLRLDYMHLEDETRLRSRDDDLLGASIWQAIGKRLRADAAYTRIADRDRDMRIRAHFTDAEHDLFVRLGYYRLLRTQGDLVLEADPFYNALNELHPYGQYSLVASKGLGEHLRLQAAADLRRVEDSGDVGFYNRDYDHYSGTVELFDFGIEQLSLSGTVDFWDSNAQLVRSWGFDADYAYSEDGSLALGTYYSLYKYDIFSNTERDHVRTWFLRLRHELSASVTLDSDFEIEDDDYDTYNRFRLGVTWRF
jgi:hypothetical protein